MAEKKIPLPEQQAAIDAVKNTVVTAGAGSGKTTVLSLRFLNLVQKHHFNVDQILTLTFTKKATVEMSDRIYKVLKEQAPEQAASFYKANIKTLDSYCNSVAKLGCRFYGISPDFVQDDSSLMDAVSTKALPFILEHRDNPVIKKFIDVTDYESVAHEIFVAPVMSRSKIAEPIDFKKDLQKQYTKIAEEWNKAVAKIGDLINEAEQLENTFTGKKENKFWKSYVEINSLPVPEPVNIDAAFVEKGDSARVVKYTIEILKKNYPKAGNTKGAEGFSDLVDKLRSAYGALKPLCNYIEGVNFVKQLVPLQEEFQEIVMTLKRQMNCLTFGDISNMALCVLRDHPEIRVLEKKKYKAIMIDEFQDNNSDQRDMLFLLAEKMDRMEKGVPSVDELMPEKLFFVGDEKQSIYKFRGADVEVFNNLAKDFADGTLRMSTNHRSHPELIAAFNTIFGGELYPAKSAETADFSTNLPAAFYTEKQQKTAEIPAYEAVYHNVLTPEKKAKECPVCGPRVHVAVFDKDTKSEDDCLTGSAAEAEWIARKIEEKISAGEEPSSMAVLMKNYSEQGVIERTFLRHGIPYDTEVVKGFFSDGPVCDMVAYLKICAYQNDTIAYSQVLHSPFVNLSLVETQAVIAQKAGYFAKEAEGVLEEDSLLRFRQAASFYNSVKETFRESSLAETITKLWYEGGYRFETMWNSTVEMYGKLYDLVFELACKGDENNMNLASFLDSLNAYSNETSKLEINIPLEKSAGVHIMSIHKSKGLEFDTVFVANTQESGKSLSNSGNIYVSGKYGITVNTDPCKEFAGEKAGNYFFDQAKEETYNKQTAEMRRLTYVALTRAINEIYITNGNYSLKKKGRHGDNLPGGAGNKIKGVWEVLAPIVEFYDEEKNRPASPFTPMEFIPAYERSEVYSGTGRKNTASARLTLVNQMKNEDLYGKAGLIEKDAVPVKYVSPSKLHKEDEETGRTAEGGQVFVDDSEAGGTDFYPEIEEVRQTHKDFGLNNFGTIAHAYMEAAINGMENVIPYSNRDIVALDGVEKDIKKIEGVCQKMREMFKKSELGKAAMDSNWHKAEYTFRSRVAGKIINGSIDLVFENDDGTYTIVDYKTNKKVEPEIYYSQLACYRQAVAKMMNIEPEKITCWLYYLRYGKPVNVTEAADGINLEQAVKELEL